MMGGFGYGGMMFGGLLMLLLTALVIVGVIWLVVTLARGSQTVAGPSATGPRPLEILKERYAKGEITKEQYEAMRRDLGA